MIYPTLAVFSPAPTPAQHRLSYTTAINHSLIYLKRELFRVQQVSNLGVSLFTFAHLPYIYFPHPTHNADFAITLLNKCNMDLYFSCRNFTFYSLTVFPRLTFKVLPFISRTSPSVPPSFRLSKLPVTHQCTTYLTHCPTLSFTFRITTSAMIWNILKKRKTMKQI